MKLKTKSRIKIIYFNEDKLTRYKENLKILIDIYERDF